MTETIAGISIPDSSLAKEATELVRESATELVYHHSRRTFLFASLRGQERGLQWDPELLYVGAMFHDLGLTERHRTDDQRFEIDGADVARDFLLQHGIAEEPALRVWTSIALHTTPEVPMHMAPEIELVSRGVELDVMGIGYDAISDEQRAAVVAAPSPAGLQERHPGRLHRRNPAPAGDDLRQCEGRRAAALRARFSPWRLRRGDQGLVLA